jgi:uncharacterized protein (DUF1697 family)
VSISTATRAVCRADTVRRVPDRHVAFLRGIAPMNPLMRNSELRAVFEGLGFRDVATVLSSGNVLFGTSETDGAALESTIERALQEHLGAPCATFVRLRDRMRRLAASGVFDGVADEEPLRCMVTFLKGGHGEPPPLPFEQDGSTALALHDDALLSVIDSTRAPTFLRWMEGVFGRVNTTRSWRTVRRVIDVLDG